MIADRLLTATYRLQLHKDFGFADVRAIASYLHRLGVSHVYSSPILRARPGSTHGYDVADPKLANPELGGEQERIAMVDVLHEQDLGLILDIVPNHMGTGSENPYWEDLLTHGQASATAHWFDVYWSAPARGGPGRLHLPVLGDEREAVIARGELEVVWENDTPRIAYFENRFPTDPATLPRILPRETVQRAELPTGDRAALDEVLGELERLPHRGTASQERRGSRRARADAALNRLRELTRRSPAVRDLITATVERFAEGDVGARRMTELLEAQPYRLAFWRTAPRDLNYRRFFDINELAALRTEDAEVFAETHETVLGWIGDGSLDGIRIDHIDGLLHPAQYLARLRAAIRARGAEREHDAFPIYIEKILTEGERLREDWPVQGTTGYEFLNELEAIFIEPIGHAAITRFYAALTKLPPFGDLAYQGKRRILETSLATDIARLTRLLWPIADAGRRTWGLGKGELRRAVIEFIAWLPVYRSYIDPDSGERDPEDRAVVERAARRAIERGGVPAEAIELIRRALLEPGAAIAGGQRDGAQDTRTAALRFLARFQQTSGPATAKGVEDTALYQHYPLASLNEVGGEPERPLEHAVASLHEANAERARRWPRNLLCTNTHDTKRSADVRARIDVLSEIPDRWEATVLRWRRMLRPHRTRVRDRMAPDANTEYLLFQTLVGFWPFPAATPLDDSALENLRDRVTAYMTKAVREAKRFTSWTDQDEPWEAALGSYIESLFGNRDFIRELEELVAEIAGPGMWNALSRTLIHLTAPGTPDIYQGDELWNFALVDPDNRRPVDFGERARLLEELTTAASGGGDAALRTLTRSLVESPTDGRIKLHLVRRLLGCRREHAHLFREGAYEPLTASGPHARHLFSFARTANGSAVIVLATRLPYGMAGAAAAPVGERWAQTRLSLPARSPVRTWRCQLTGVTVEAAGEGGGWLDVSSILTILPVALLTPL